MAVKSDLEKAAALRRAKEEARKGKLEALKGLLSDEERSRLRDKQAEDAIKASGEYKPAFITNALIEAKENEILRGKM